MAAPAFRKALALPQVQGSLRETEKKGRAPGHSAVLHVAQRSPKVLLCTLFADAQHPGYFRERISVQFRQHEHVPAPGLKQQRSEHGELKQAIRLWAWFGRETRDRPQLLHLPISHHRHHKDRAGSGNFVSCGTQGFFFVRRLPARLLGTGCPSGIPRLSV